MTGIDDHAANDSRQAEANDAPVQPLGVSPARLPAIHPFAPVGVLAFNENRRRGFEQLFFRRKELVVGKQHRTTEAFGGKID